MQQTTLSINIVLSTFTSTLIIIFPNNAVIIVIVAIMM